MAIHTTAVSTSDTTVYTSALESAITLLSLCNYTSSAVTVSVHIVPTGSTPTNSNIFIKDLEILARDTFIVYEGGEKIILSDDDSISVIASNLNSVNAITSYVQI